MDILKKMFAKKEQEKEKSEFRKPTWFEDDETDDELFDERAFQMFTNPVELQKNFEQQLREMLESMKQFERSDQVIEKDLKKDYLKPGFENNIYSNVKKILDSDLDGEIYADQLHSLMQRLNPNDKNIIAGNATKSKLVQSKKKLTDEEIILAKIHGSYIETEARPTRSRIPSSKTPFPHPHHPFGGVFEGTHHGPRMFGQSIIKQTVRKPDGSYETKTTVRDSDGNVKTTIHRTIEGKTDTVSSYDNSSEIKPSQVKENAAILESDRNIFVSKNGYALPKNLW